jgi:hypothetical protein
MGDDNLAGGHQWDDSLKCRMCGMSKQSYSDNSKLKCPGPPISEDILAKNNFAAFKPRPD